MAAGGEERSGEEEGRGRQCLARRRGEGEGAMEGLWRGRGDVSRPRGPPFGIVTVQYSDSIPRYQYGTA